MHSPHPSSRTHDVANQPPPFFGGGADGDVALREGLAREGAAWAVDDLCALGRRWHVAERYEQGFVANRKGPEIRTHDRYGHRVDEIDFHPAWHDLLGRAVADGLHASPWRDPRLGAHVARAAALYLIGQVEQGISCPISMTYGAIPALARHPQLAAAWVPVASSLDYDPRQVPIQEKRGALVGMAMTEKQGGSDVRANTTRAERIGDHPWGEAYRLTGHKWFCSAPQIDGWLMLAQAEGGLSCFFVPHWTPEGPRNRIFVQRLKDKLGNRSNASSEIEIDGAFGIRLGDEGRGVPIILEMGNYTRLDCTIGSSALMRAALVQAIHHARHRAAFGKLLSAWPMMQTVLADLALETEASLALSLRLARAWDGRADEAEGAFARLGTALGKYWVCRRGVGVTAEAAECLGGAGYVEETILPRLYREAPLNAIWEGSGNVICLDVLRVLRKEPIAYEVLRNEIAAARDQRIDEYQRKTEASLGDPEDSERDARRWVERLAMALQASLLVRGAPAAVSEAFVTARLSGEGGLAFGALPRSVDGRAIVERALPA